MARTASATCRPCAISTSTCRSFATISSAVCLFLAIDPILHRKTILQGGPLQRGQITTKGTSANDQAHWRKTTNLMWTHLAIWFFFGYVIHFFAPALNKIVILGFPLGFYMAAQGSLIAFVVQLFLFAKQQDKIDREFGVAED
ncbi:MAG: DUF4212 domain-containing protein [Xanthobacteraceae bacterium]